MLDRVLVIEDFADKVGEVFAVSLQDADIALNLIESSPLPNRRGPDSRLPFSLLFRGSDPRMLQQQLYRVTHGSLGEMAIFLVPVGKDDAGIQYQATFN